MTKQLDESVHAASLRNPQSQGRRVPELTQRRCRTFSHNRMALSNLRGMPSRSDAVHVPTTIV